jgi:hypothetical protein
VDPWALKRGLNHPRRRRHKPGTRLRTYRFCEGAFPPLVHSCG